MDRAWVAVCLVCLLVLVPFGLLSACAFPNYDDFAIAAGAESVGGSAALLVRAGGLHGVYPFVPGLAFLLMVLGTWRLLVAAAGSAMTGFQQIDLESKAELRRSYAGWLGADSVTIAPRH